MTRGHPPGGERGAVFGNFTTGYCIVNHVIRLLPPLAVRYRGRLSDTPRETIGVASGAIGAHRLRKPQYMQS